MLPEAIKNPLIYLNFAIHCYETGRIEQAQLNLSNYAKMTEQMKVRIEVQNVYCCYCCLHTRIEHFVNFIGSKIGKAFEKLIIELSKYGEINDEPTPNDSQQASDALNDDADRNEEETFQENLV